MTPGQLGRYLRTVQHLTPAQIGHRARLLALRASYRRLPRITAAHYQRLAETHPAGWAEHTLLPGTGSGDPLPATEPIEEARRIAAGQFRFVNRTAELGARPAWRSHGQSQLWSYHLHYFDYLLSLGLWWHNDQAPEALDTAARLMADWIEHNPPAGGDGWHPYPVAARLSNWLQGLELFGSSLRTHPLLQPLLLHSVTQQALFLERNLEFDVLGNHLIKNLRALVHCGLALDHPKSRGWLHQGALWTFAQIRHQILPDGGHYERSPMYQLQVFWDLMDILAQLHRVGIMIPADVRERWAAMLDWIRVMRHPDGDIPLFNDAVLGMAGAPNEALAAGAAFLGIEGEDLSWRGRLLLGTPPTRLPLPVGEGGGEGTASVIVAVSSVQGVPSLPPSPTGRGRLVGGDAALRDSGYYVLAGPSAWLVADAGDPCPDELPAHAHADALSYELSVHGQRMIVDAGMFEYQAGIWRDFMRGTAAHNTVMVDGTDQSEVWGSFRVGRRAHVHARHWSERDGVRLLEAEHDGYQDTLQVRHRRWIARVDQRFFVIADLLEGYGEHEVRSFIHLHPDAVVGDASMTDEMQLIGASLGETGLMIAPFGHDDVAHFVGDLGSPRAWYSQELGRRLPSTEISLILNGAHPRVFGYLLLLDTPLSISSTSDSPTQWHVDVEFEHGHYVMHVNAAGIRIERP